MMERIEPWRVPPWPAVIYIGVLLPLLPVVHAGIPWALSLWGTRHGWFNGAPAGWNLAGVAPVVAGFSCVIYCVCLHFVAEPKGWKLERTPAHLIVKGPYRYSRNPIYLSIGFIWLGWTVFYGSLTVLVALLTLAFVFGPLAAKFEERGLEARFGPVYRDYARVVPRWL